MGFITGLHHPGSLNIKKPYYSFRHRFNIIIIIAFKYSFVNYWSYYLVIILSLNTGATLVVSILQQYSRSALKPSFLSLL